MRRYAGCVWLYRLLRGLLRFLASVFFRQVEVVGEEWVPKDGEAPVLFIGNHPNSLLDPVVIIAFSPRSIRFAAKDTLFKSRFLRLFLSGLGAVPVKRRSDHPGAEVDNSAMFDELFSVLERGGAVGIFPEGLSHDESQLAKLKTGAARIAVGLAERDPKLALHVVPCGLNYVHRNRFRSRVLLQFGAPIVLNRQEVDRICAGQENKARALTEHFEQAIRSLTINATDWNTIRVLDGVRRLYQPRASSFDERVELARRFNAVYPKVRTEPDITQLFARVAAYQDSLDELELRDLDLSRAFSAREVSLRLLGLTILMAIWLPLAGPGALLHLPLGLLISFAGNHLSPRKDVIATTKFVVGVVATFLAFVGIGVYAFLQFGAAGAVTVAIGFPLSGFATLKVIERWAALRHAFRTFRRLVFLRDEVESLRTLRDQLQREVFEVVHRYLPTDMDPLFPHRARGTEVGE